MKTLQTEITIHATQAQVWQVLTNFEAYPAWNPFIVSIEGKPAKGAGLVTQMVQNGKKYRFTPTITAYAPERELEWLGQLPLGLFKGRHYFELEAISAAETRLRHGEFFSGPLSGLILKKIGQSTLQGFERMNQALKQRAEAL